MMNFSPIPILERESTEERGENARLASFVGAIAISDLVKTTMGPKGMDKILQSGSNIDNVTVTNDGATILKSIFLDNAAAKVLVDIAKVQDEEVGDGTTSVTVLCGELLREGEKLIAQKIHPSTIIQGWRIATDTARHALEQTAKDNRSNPEQFRLDLLNIARTTLSSKILTHHKDHFANMAVDAILRLKDNLNLENIQIIKKVGGSLRDSFLEPGFLLDKKIGVGQPKRMENCKILVADTPMDTDKVKIFGSRVRVDSAMKMAEIEKAEKDKMLTKCEKILAHGCNVFINRQLVYNLPEQFFADHGILCIEHADFDGIERLAAVTGGDIVSTFDTPDQVKLGEVELIEEVMIGEDKMIRFSGVKAGEACSIVLRGGSQQMLDEAERSLHDALCVIMTAVKDSQIVYGGGCSEVLMAKAVDEKAAVTPGKRSLAIEAFGRALRMIPTIISDNAGYDSADLVAKLRAAHYEGMIASL
eukprot:TRINITY_DN1015_c0_g1_i2.p1 TRINITY_DN1015_c0_g1~~TRINITY_DN1015_c0_g1_i2.p1  ORF type:complete len:476 (-),score=130.34 TRINITY_DN1015_c0_g1_i2:971-2398(-)